MPASIPALIANRYQVLRELGQGGMGTVYLVKHTHTGEPLALKILKSEVGTRPDVIERFKREMRAPARIRSEYVVRVTDADVAPELGGVPFLVMELLDGCDLAEVLQHRGKLAPEEVVWILRQVAKALDKAHALGIIHRDLKPGNLYLHRKEEQELIIKLLDFGIARLTAPANLGIDAEKVTQTGLILGTPAYLSPEQARADLQNIGPPSDIWSLGIMAFKFLTGASFWLTGNTVNLLEQILFAPLPKATQRAPFLPAAFDDWFERSCNREPAQRWTSAGEQVAALAAALDVDLESISDVKTPAGLYASWQALEAEIPSDHEPAVNLPIFAEPPRSSAELPVPSLPAVATGIEVTEVVHPRQTIVSRRQGQLPGKSSVLRTVSLISIAMLVCAGSLLFVLRRSSQRAQPAASTAANPPLSTSLPASAVEPSSLPPPPQVVSLPSSSTPDLGTAPQVAKTTSVPGLPVGPKDSPPRRRSQPPIRRSLTTAKFDPTAP